MNRIRLICVVWILTSLIVKMAHGQEQAKTTVSPLTHTLQVEALGPGVGYPLPALYYQLSTADWAFRLGGSIARDTHNGVTMITVPASASYIGLKSPSGTHGFEIGVGVGVVVNARADDYDGMGDWYGFDGKFCVETDDEHQCKPGTTSYRGSVHGIIGYRLQIEWFQMRIGISPTLTIGTLWPLPYLSLGYSL